MTPDATFSVLVDGVPLTYEKAIKLPAADDQRSHRQGGRGMRVLPFQFDEARGLLPGYATALAEWLTNLSVDHEVTRDGKAASG